MTYVFVFEQSTVQLGEAQNNITLVFVSIAFVLSENHIDLKDLMSCFLQPFQCLSSHCQAFMRHTFL